MADWVKEAKAMKNKVYAEWVALKTPENMTYYYNAKTGVTTWDKPDALKTDEELAASGDWVWMPDDQEVYLPARIVSKTGTTVTLQTESGQTVNLPVKTKLDPLKLSSLQRIVPDLTLLDSMSTPLILHNLKHRFLDKKIYTNIGTILVSINPYQNLGLYTPDVTKEYMYRGVKVCGNGSFSDWVCVLEMPPHVFNVAHDAYRSLCEFHQNNSIIISGESGAGKTEATKQCLSYVAAVAGSLSGVEQKVLMANPILEAFGNAKTLRNDNSSRFGKYLEIFFTPKERQICSSTTTNYLLEKVRVIKQAQGERNFHAFYQLTKAASQAERQKYCIGEPADYNYLAMSGCIDVDTVDDFEDFKAVKEALETLQFSAQEQEQMWMLTSAILALGNIEFRATGDKKCDIPDKGWLDVAAGLMQIPSADLSKAMLVKELRIRGQANTQVSQGVKEAGDSRDALAKYIYSKMFDWLVVKINQSMGSSGKGNKSIGILDIFGFEIFKENSFEQLCINYTNEMLQQHFNAHTFKLEEQLYKQEKIPFVHIEFIDNQPVLDLIEAKGQGVLPILDEELVMPKGSDATFLQKMNDKHPKSKYYQRVLKNPNQFMINHYAGAVVYDVAGFLEKNRDTLTDDLLEMVHKAKLPLLNTLFPKDQVMSTKDKKSSLAKQFQKQLHDLMYTLNATEPHYIRCVKPNPTKSATTFIPRMAYEQLTYSGVFEAVAIRKQGYPFRLTHNAFYERYKCILPDPEKRFPNDKAACLAICEEMKLNKQNVQMGVTMLLYRSDEFKSLELQYSIKVEKIRMNQTLKELMAKDPSGLKDKERDMYYEQLSRAVNMANEFNLQSDVANSARKRLDDYIESRMDDNTRALLETALHEVSEEKLAEAIAIADGYEYETKLVKECKRMYKRILRINEEAAKAIEILEELPMQIVLDAADEIKLVNDSINYIREVLALPKETFIKMQMGVATKLKDHARCIRITIKLKDLMFNQMKDSAMFEIRNYGRMKKPDFWAAEKFINLNAEQRQAGMLKWTKDSIHTSLTELKHHDPNQLKE